MQEQHLNQMLKNAFANDNGEMMKALKAQRQSVDMSLFQKQAEQIKVETVNLPEGMRTPNADEVYSMNKFAADYRRQSPKASKREIRKALLRKFNLTILPDECKI